MWSKKLVRMTDDLAVPSAQFTLPTQQGGRPTSGHSGPVITIIPIPCCSSSPHRFLVLTTTSLIMNPSGLTRFYSLPMAIDSIIDIWTTRLTAWSLNAPRFSAGRMVTRCVLYLLYTNGQYYDPNGRLRCARYICPVQPAPPCRSLHFSLTLQGDPV
ncbi:hypothetical protein BD413DRAFT_204164 [Trametes elegans]|nr:hypothetical protein BD413DRAFT_204164 [Trametes elegans]